MVLSVSTTSTSRTTGELLERAHELVDAARQVDLEVDEILVAP
jgi:hypothetical protein